MKKLFNFLLITCCTFFLLVGSATAGSFEGIYSFDDIYTNWPGQSYPVDWDNKDEQGTPKISDMTVIINDTNNLQSIMIGMEGRRVYDNLFINIGGNTDNWESWDFYVNDTTFTNGLDGATLSTVAAGYTYSYVTKADHADARIGHANGIATGLVGATDGILAGVSWFDDEDELIYTFHDGIAMGENWTIGYTPWCANDVFLTPVPEPATMVLLGFGLLGLAGITRKKIS